MHLKFRRKQSYESLVKPHLGNLYRLAYRYTSSSHEAEDLVQDLLLKLLPQHAKLAEVEQLGPWLARSLHNLYIDKYRKKFRTAVDLTDGRDQQEVLETIADEVSVSPERAAEQVLTQRKLVEAMQLLSPEHRAIIAWHDIEGYSLSEIAEEHAISLGTLKSRLHRARASLREKIMEPFSGNDRVRVVRK